MSDYHSETRCTWCDGCGDYGIWTAVKRASEEGKSIPLGWALDAEGNPTADALKGLAGSMAPSGGYKGFGQGLIVEVMCAALASSFRGLISTAIRCRRLRCCR